MQDTLSRRLVLGDEYPIMRSESNYYSFGNLPMIDRTTICGMLSYPHTIGEIVAGICKPQPFI